MKKIFILFFCSLCITFSNAQNLQQLWESPQQDSKSWVFWYWMHSAVTKEGITADLEAMKEAGIGGAYLMPIKGAPEKPFITPPVEQLSPEWWQMVDFAMKEADRVGVKIAFHICDGFALAGGPWITPELSMQKVVWSELNIKGGKTFNDILPQPKSYKGYYKDIAVFAYPAVKNTGFSTENVKATVSTSISGIDPQFLADRKSNETFRSESPCWIQYTFEQPFTCRTIQIEGSGNNLQAQRFEIEASDDGINFRKVAKLESPRSGWQNTGIPMTHSIPETTARYFRFNYNSAGTEPGSEDLDAGKWKQTLKIKNIYLSSSPKIHQYEGKTGEIWRVSPRTTTAQIPDELCINPQQIVDVTKYMDANGNLKWKAPKGEWTILRMGHTSTGYTNETGGKGSGLECDKFNPEAIKLQFDSWFGKAVELAGPELAARVLKIFHVDSWECGSQNWSSDFRDEFMKRRGYDLYDYLPAMAGIPVQNIDISERFLYDVRQTIAELIVDRFYGTLQKEAHAKGVQFSAESVAPTMLSDGMMHYKSVDIPMGEFWLQSPTHDKPNDLSDALSGGHVYEKNIIQAESFTQLRIMWNEHPEMLKSLQDRHYALGINRLSYHVFAHNPWLDRKPGMTLDGIGLYFQRDQTWWKPGKAWVDYAQRCQSLLQFGKPVIDIAVFTGEELPRRSLTIDRLVPFIPGIFGEEKVQEEKKRLDNAGTPTDEMPVGVTYSNNIMKQEEWVNALRGYAYDSFNPDALLNLAKVENGNIVLPGGMSYKALIVPGKHPMQPNPERMSYLSAEKIYNLANQGATIMVSGIPDQTPGLDNYKEDEQKLSEISKYKEIFSSSSQNTWNIGKGKVIRLPYLDATFDKIGIARDFIARDDEGFYAKGIAYTHRSDGNTDIYFVSNQENNIRQIDLSLRVSGKQPELWNPVNGTISKINNWKSENGRTLFPIQLDASESVFIVLREATNATTENNGENWFTLQDIIAVDQSWIVSFDTLSGGPVAPVVFPELKRWEEHENEQIRFYSGTAMYRNKFNWKANKAVKDKRIFLELDEVHDLADIKVNGKSCGIIWTKPYRVEITDIIKNGSNSIEIEVTNTWANRITGNELTPDQQHHPETWTNAPYRSKDKALVKSGLGGKVMIKAGN